MDKPTGGSLIFAGANMGCMFMFTLPLLFLGLGFVYFAFEPIIPYILGIAMVGILVWLPLAIRKEIKNDTTFQ